MKRLAEHIQGHGAWLLVSATLAGCVSPQALPDADYRSGYVVAGAGAARIDADRLDGTLEVAENTSVSAHLGLGYQFNGFSAVELRLANLGGVEYEDGRQLDYQLVDATGLVMLRQKNASVFARLGVGTFRNEGDFDVELNNPVHPVIGGGLVYHATPNIDLRLSVSSHDVDAVWSKLSLVWRFSRRSSAPAVIAAKNGGVVFDNSESDGFKSVEPVTDINVEDSIAGVAESGLQIDEKPVPNIQTEPVLAPAPAVSQPLTAPSQKQISVPDVVLVPGDGVESEPVAVEVTLEPASFPLEPDTVLPIGPLMFEQGRATLTPPSRADLEELVDLLNVNSTLQLNVEAHAAPVGNAELNMLLSRRRALTVIRLLVDQGIEATRLRPQAFGDTLPIPDASSIDLNDRIELRVR